jgi:hypothetical protein
MAHTREGRRIMGLILLEAFGALLLLLVIVWWTMFSGRSKGEPKRPENTGLEDKNKL